MKSRMGRIIAALALVAVASGSTLASGGSVYVTSACDYPSIQDNTIDQGSDVYLWLKLNGAGVDGLVAWTVDNPGGATQGPLGLTWDSGCTTFGSKYRFYHLDGFDSSVPGSYTLTLWYSAKKDAAVSSDSFRIVAP